MPRILRADIATAPGYCAKLLIALKRMAVLAGKAIKDLFVGVEQFRLDFALAPR